MGSRHGERIIVGIDNGTTTTEIIFGLSSSEDFEFLREWPGALSSRPFECPSIISYGQDGIKWGFEVPETLSSVDRKFVWFKMLLDDTLERREFYDEALQHVLRSKVLQLPDGQTPVSVMTGFLFQVYDHLSRILISMFGDEKFHQGAIDFYFTIPACWVHETQEAMRTAIENAGFGSCPLHEVKLLAEPEAAIMSVIQETHLKIETGDGVMICDCGGGTVDIATYHVTDLANSSLERISTTMGGKCGGASIDCRLYEHLDKLSGGGVWSLPLNDILTGGSLMNTFEIIKSKFSGHSATGHTFKLSGNISGHHMDAIPLRGEEIERIYQPVLQKIFQMLISELNAVQAKYNHHIINKIVFVGGFSKSPYLQNWMQRSLQQFHGVKVLISEQPSLAVAKGALIRGKYEFEGRLLERIIKCWRHYGVVCSSLNTSLQNETHSAMQLPYKVQCWVLQKDRRYQLPYSRIYELIIPHLPSDPLTKVINIYECTSEDTQDLLQSGNPNINLIGYIPCDFNQIDIAQFVQPTLDGRVCYAIRVSIKVSLRERQHKIKFVASVHGKEVGQHRISMAIL
ncbi:hypothetical protein N7540_003407 [Penicillium herquei]|nr:hypothetical protein N7540_003407 [Penicillium herquei]